MELKPPAYGMISSLLQCRLVSAGLPWAGQKGHVKSWHGRTQGLVRLLP